VEHKLGFICAKRWHCHSNVAGDGDKNEIVLLLPEDPERSAKQIREKIKEKLNNDVWHY